MRAPLDEAGLSCGRVDMRDLFHCIHDQEKIAVAVSGGSDSLALLLLLVDWASEHKKDLHCLTVDHGLRAASHNEAGMVASLCAELGIAHDILTWDGEKPATGLSNAARDARYELMAERCLDLGIFDLVLGHQSDDQAETLLMRLSRSDQGGRGLAGMPAQTEYQTEAGGKVSLHRPLLHLTRAKLQDYLSKRSVKWVSDPTNDNTAYERVRTRLVLAKNEVLRDQLLSYARVSARYRSALSHEVAHFIAHDVSNIRFGGLSMDLAALNALPKPAAIVVLQALLSVVGGRDYLPSAKDVQRVLENIGGQTLSRVHIHREGGSLYLTREVRNLPCVKTLGDGAVCWDKRFSIQTSRPNADLVSGVDLDAEHVNELVEEIQPPLSKIEKIAFQSSPFLLFSQNGKITAVACLGQTDSKFMSVLPRYGGFHRFCGAFDKPIRCALETLLTK